MKIPMLVLTLLISIPAAGQNHLIGMKGGMNRTNVIATNFVNDNENRSGFHGGLTYEYRLDNGFNLGMDVLYIQKGFANDIVFNDEYGNPTGKLGPIEYNYDYLSFPLKGGFAVGDVFSGFANLGIVPSVLIDAKTTTPALDGMMEETTANVTDKVSRFDLGGLVEIGVGYRVFTDILLSASLGYQHSITSITNDNYYSESELRHHGVTLSMGVKYALK